MDEELRAVWARARRYHHRFTIAICDIDRFKIYNDHFGHLAGDKALKAVALSLRHELRESDGLYRYGGEEFVVVLPDRRSPMRVSYSNDCACRCSAWRSQRCLPKVSRLWLR
jgi:diguanylate cyclase (GGDEF)-like protein